MDQFKQIQAQYLELIRQGKRSEALAYARKFRIEVVAHLTPDREGEPQSDQKPTPLPPPQAE